MLNLPAFKSLSANVKTRSKCANNECSLSTLSIPLDGNAIAFYWNKVPFYRVRVCDTRSSLQRRLRLLLRLLSMRARVACSKRVRVAEIQPKTRSWSAKQTSNDATIWIVRIVRARALHTMSTETAQRFGTFGGQNTNFVRAPARNASWLTRMFCAPALRTHKYETGFVIAFAKLIYTQQAQQNLTRRPTRTVLFSLKPNWNWHNLFCEFNCKWLTLCY